MCPLPAAAAVAAGAGTGPSTAAITNGINIAGASAASLDAIGGQAFGIANLILQNRYYKEQRDWQRYVYEDQKKLNDPAYIMERRRLAGLNPYGDFSGGMSTGQPTPVSASGIGDALNGLSGSLSRSAESAFKAISNRLAVKTLELQEKQTDAALTMTEQQIEQLKSTTAYQDLINEITESSKGSMIELNRLQAEKLVTDILMEKTNLEFLPENLRAQISKLNSETALNTYNVESYLPGMLLQAVLNGQSQRELNDSIIGMNEQQVKNLAEQLENLKIQGAGVKELKKMIDNMPDGFGKSFMTALLIVLQSNLKK